MIPSLSMISSHSVDELPGTQGAEMDADSAMALALAIEDILG